MRKIVQKQIMDMIPAIWDGVQYIQTVESNRAVQVLDDCLLAMETLQESFRSGLSPQRFLYYKQYYDQVVLAMKQLKDIGDTENQIIGIYNGLDKMLSDITHEAEVKVEILFLPYKASMWDSLESIWLAAKDDSKCDAYVVPIPYCDRKPGGQADEWHCEAELFPSYVPITKFEEYNIAKREPDVIYIHNPYDGYNFVTSVHQDYYSDVLKKHTAMLVYVPYFVTGGLLPASFYALPSYTHVDKIIIQSKKMIPYYSPELTKDKLVPLGSPKVDRILYYEKNKPQIPAEWAKRIGNKKVVFYNTSLSGILTYRERALQKMRYVFSCFEGRDDIIVLWRPHPLTKATLKSMIPDLLEGYTKIEEYFIRNEIGIFDITADVTTSIAISDAYLGEDSSSVVYLFGVTGKPIFSTNMTITKTPDEDEKASLLFWECCVENEKLWMVVDGYNALCEMDLVSGKTKALVKFDDTHITSTLYSRAVNVGNILIFPPFNAKKICEYNVKTRKVKLTPIKDPLGWGNFGRAVHYKHYVFMIPYRYPAIMRYDLRTGKCTYYTECVQELLKFRTKDHQELLGKVCVRNNKILAPSGLSNHVLEFNMDNGNYKLYIVGPTDANYTAIIDAGYDYWLIPNTTKSIVRWNYETGQIKEYSNYPDGFECSADWSTGDTYMFSAAVYCQDILWLFPSLANMILRIDITTGEMKQVDLHLPYEENMRKSQFYMQQPNYLCANNYGDTYVIALSAYDRSMLIIDTKTEKYRLIPCRLAVEDIQKFSRPLHESFGRVSKDAPYVSNEDGLWINIDAFLEYVIDGHHSSQLEKKSYAEFITNMDGTCGGKVHQYITKQIGE